MEIVETLVNIGSAKIVYCCKLNPVIEAVKLKKYKIASFLASKGADVNWRGPNSPSLV